MALPTLRQLEYIVTVAEEGSFVKASKICSVSQPALSKQIQEVESLLGITIFERARPRTRVTQAGAPIVEQARVVLREARELTHVAAQLQEGSTCSIHLGVIPTISPYLLPILLEALQEEKPNWRVFLHEDQTDNLLQSLEKGEVDVLLLALPVPGKGLVSLPLFEDPFVLVSPSQHPLSQVDMLKNKMLKEHTLMLMEEGHCFRDQALEVCSSVGAVENLQIRAASLTTLSLMVQQGIGATLMPAISLPFEKMDPKKTVIRSFERKPPSRVLGLVWRNSSVLQKEYQELGALLKTIIPDLMDDMPGFIQGPEPDFNML